MPRPDENHEATMTARSDFTAGWSLRLADPADQSVPEPVRSALPIPATVPGTVHTDLLAAGLIPDPYLDENEAALTWIGHAAWVYEREYEHDLVDGEHVVLAFGGLDTVATVTVNDVVVARTENMHRRYEVPIEHALRDGVNAVAVRFDSAWSFGEAERARIGDLPNAYPENPFNFLRKSACNFGWDWGPALVTAGIWRDVALVRHTGPRIRSVRPTLTVEAGTGRADFVVELDRVVADAVVVEASVGDAHAARRIEPGHFEVSVSIEVDDPELWWPAGFGEQPMYDAVVTIRSEQGDRHDAWGAPVAFRSLRLDTTPDADGTPFVFVVNDVPVPIRGVNWIPDDVFLPRVTAERVRERIRQATDAHVNLVRVWGGGVYESESFYRACDEAGVLVWQDFLFACAAYPEDERLAREVDAEARDNVARLMHHPSLVLWNGNNENIWGYEDWDWKAAIGDRTWGLGYYLDLLPTAVAETDPSRPYWPGSPYSGSLEIPPNDADHALTHIWDVWNQRDYLAYREWRSRFAAEFGWQAPPTWSTLVRAIHDEPMTPESPAMLTHQKAIDGAGKLERGLAPHLPMGRDLADWHFAMQLNQAKAVRVGVEHFRSLRPRNMGTIVWQLNDCWPVISWSAVDGDGRPKPLWYALRAAHEPRLLTIQPREGGLALVAVNDTREPWADTAIVRRVAFDGTVLAEATLTLEVDALDAQTLMLASALAEPDVATGELLVAETGGARALWTFAEDRDLDLLDPALQLAVARDGDDVVLSVVAGAFVRDLCVFADRIAPAAEADDLLITLLPGERRTIRVNGIPAGRERELLTAPVLRTVNDLVLGSRAATA